MSLTASPPHRGTAACAALAAAAIVSFGLAVPSPASDGVQLRVVGRSPNAKSFYKPGDSIVLELRCAPGVTDVNVQYNPTLLDGDAGFVFDEEPKCPRSRFEVPIPRDFIGKNRVTATTRNRRPPSRAVFRFEVRSEGQPTGLWFSTDTQNEGCNLFYVRDNPDNPTVGLFSVLPDGTRLDLCREGKAVVGVVPPQRAIFAMKNGVCTLRLKGAPSPDFRVFATYRGLRKEWACTKGGPSDAPRR